MTISTMSRIAWNYDVNRGANSCFYCLPSRWLLQKELYGFAKCRPHIVHCNTRGEIDGLIIFATLTFTNFYALKTTSAKGFSELCEKAVPYFLPPDSDVELRPAA